MAERPKRQRTTTSNFGVGKRENHDASGFYERFGAPQYLRGRHGQPAPESSTRSGCTTPARCPSCPMHRSPSWSPHPRTSPARRTRRSWARAPSRPATSSTSRCSPTCSPSAPGCSSRAAASRSTSPTSGRKPYRSLSADVTHILQDRLGLLLRGEIIWQKARRRRRQLRVGQLPERQEPGAARPHRAGDRGQQGPFRPGPRHRQARRPRACPARAPSARTTSSTSRSTCGSSHPSPPPASATRRRSPSSSPSG